ncbi:MAG TPA: shikimate kinase [Gillisia sp.]|nr:shikimate kinase [Gillisia sp.]
MKLFLTGYMGSGKSYIGKILARELSIPFIDLDDQIVKLQGKEIPDIFREKGEIFFRKLETEVLKDILENKNSLVVALGGGTPCYGNNLDLIKNDTQSRIIYLKASVNFLTERLFAEKDSRPVISHLDQKEDLEDFIRKHLFERSYYYLQANQIINVEEKSPGLIVEEIMRDLQ